MPQRFALPPVGRDGGDHGDADSGEATNDDAYSTYFNAGKNEHEPRP